ncbi:MAG TPA: hypothetical protein VNO75_09785, partial [Gemmatimonadaceae bacterium]|nr:hypothetical protein [Gemmatimonadaceae bacterium]
MPQRSCISVGRTLLRTPPELEAIARYLEILTSLADQLAARSPRRGRRSLDLRGVTVAKAIAA